MISLTFPVTYPCGWTVKHRLTSTRMADNQDWYIFLSSVKCLCREVERRIYSSHSDTLQEFLFRLQSKRTASDRIIGASLGFKVNPSVSANVQGNVKRISNSLQYLTDDVECQLHSVDSTAYSC